jgi:hypothetical protein
MIARDVSLFAHGHRAPVAVIARVGPMLAALNEAEEGTKHIWQNALEEAFRCLDPRWPVEKQVTLLLDVVCASTASVPPQFRRRDPTHVARAQRFLRNLRLKDGRERVHQQRATRRGPYLSRWGAAARFAQCFGVQTMRESERDGRRGRSRK